MYIVTKMLWLFAQPLTIVFLLVLAATLCWLFGYGRAGAAASGLASLILFVTLFTSSGTVALQVLEERIARPANPPENLACMIVLGGAFDNEINTARGGFELNQAADRFVEALRLARDYPEARVLVSGGDGSLSGNYESEAVTAERFFAAFGVGAERLIQEDASRTTYENIRNTARLLGEGRTRDCLLITSAYHMPRSTALFREAGLEITPWPVDYRTSGRAVLKFDFTQPALNAQLTTTATREWTSLAFHYFTGRIDSPFPQ